MFWPTLETFYGLGQYISIGSKMAVGAFIFMLSMEIRLVFAGLIGESETAATAVLINITYA